MWRWSDDPTEGRVIYSDISYPVDPANIEVYHANRPTNVSFYVNFPPTDDIPLDVMLLQVTFTHSWIKVDFVQDLSAKFSINAQYILTLISYYGKIHSTYPLSKFGIASFIDKPKSPYGSSSKKDFVYKLNQPLTDKELQVLLALATLKKGDGKDDKNAQLEALFHLANDNSVKWRGK